MQNHKEIFIETGRECGAQYPHDVKTLQFWRIIELTLDQVGKQGLEKVMTEFVKYTVQDLEYRHSQELEQQQTQFDNQVRELNEVMEALK